MRPTTRRLQPTRWPFQPERLRAGPVLSGLVGGVRPPLSGVVKRTMRKPAEVGMALPRISVYDRRRNRQQQSRAEDGPWHQCRVPGFDDLCPGLSRPEPLTDARFLCTSDLHLVGVGPRAPTLAMRSPLIASNNFRSSSGPTGRHRPKFRTVQRQRPMFLQGSIWHLEWSLRTPNYFNNFRRILTAEQAADGEQKPARR